MRILHTVCAVLALISIAAPAWSQAAAPERLSARDLQHWLTTVQKPGKPGAGVSAIGGNDSCQHANDMECDEPGVGTGACPAGTDRSDCWRIMSGEEDNSCQWAHDGECDEPRLGTGVCTQGTDLADCGDLSGLRFRTDACDLAFNGVCDEPGEGTGRCEARTDRSDCAGRERPMSFDDHFFGRDDRVLLDTGEAPWSRIGTVSMDAGGTCTATLIGPDILLTAAHCIEGEQGRVNARGTFETGFDLQEGPVRARVIDYLTDPGRAAAVGTEQDDPLDWALLRLDRRLGDTVGWLGVRTLTRDLGRRAGLEERIYQAGYSWDTGENLSGNTDCRVVEIYADTTFAHECDTTQGDSGSPFLIEDEGGWFVIGSDSTYRRVETGPVINIAVGAEAWVDRLEAFASGEAGANATRPMGGGKPGVTGARKPGG